MVVPPVGYGVIVKLVPHGEAKTSVAFFGLNEANLTVETNLGVKVDRMFACSHDALIVR